jgi:hypothetical protein
MPKKSTRFAPPYKDLKTPNGLKNQKTPRADKSGFCSKKINNTSLTDIQLEDLRRISRLNELYRQAVSARWLTHSETNFRNFVAAAVRATGTTGNPVRVFVAIIRQHLWQHITLEQEERANIVIRNFQERVGVASTTPYNESLSKSVQEVIIRLSNSLGM